MTFFFFYSVSSKKKLLSKPKIINHNQPAHPPCRAPGREGTARLPCPRARDVRSGAARPVGARSSSPAGGPDRRAAVKRLEAAGVKLRSPCPHPAAVGSPTGAAGAGGERSESTGHWRASTDPDSGDTAAAGTAVESTVVGSPRTVCVRAAARWSTDPERPNPAGTVWNCGSVPHHGGPSDGKRI